MLLLDFVLEAAAPLDWVFTTGTDVVAVVVEAGVAFAGRAVDDDTLAAADDVILLFDVEDNDGDDEEDNELEEFTEGEELGRSRWSCLCCCCPADE